MKNLKLYNEIKAEVRNVIEAEEAAASWKVEARERMKDVSALIVAAKKVNNGIEIDQKELVDFIRSEIAEEAAEDVALRATYVANPDAYPSMDTPEQ